MGTMKKKIVNVAIVAFILGLVSPLTVWPAAR